MADPYTPDQEAGYTKPPKNPGADSEGGTRVVGPASHTGGIHVQGGVPVVPIDFDPRAPGVVQQRIDPRIARNPGAVPTRLNYNPLDKGSAGVRPTPIRGNPHMKGSGGQQAIPWYVLKQEISQKGLPDQRAYEKACGVAFLHAQQGSFIPADIGRILYGQWQYGSRTAGAFLTYCQRLQQRYGRR